ncbi:DUF2793 domain-containing protein [Cucumibacter marinus]|uniref:DUF2793 domain-containing protein n=1 Tax=Cucumibacter marinus TaxID=1121252 RepID=UPI000417498D|nr:DUF2793 domain-containing protein [Cucumibacter marinus]
MTSTPILGLPYIAANQALKHITHNQALRTLDALVQLNVLTRIVTEPPAEPVEGARYIIADGATGDWTDMQGHIAVYEDGAWMLITPGPGWLAWVVDEGALLAFEAGAWVPAAVRSGVLQFGVNTAPDATNRLAVKSDAILLSHDDVTPGSGDMRTVINKQAPVDTASLLFQSGWSGRAEMGLSGDDDFRVKVSGDGAAWHEGLVIDSANGRVRFPSGGVREILFADRTYHVSPAGDDADDGLTSGTAFATIQNAVDTVYGTLDLGGHDVAIQLAPGTYDGFDAVNPQVGAGTITVRGNTGDLDQCVIADHVGSSIVINVENYGTRIALEGLTVTRTNTTNLIRAFAGARIDLVTNNKVSGAGRSHSLMADALATIELKGTLVAADQCYSLLYAGRNGYLTIAGATLDFSSAPDIGVVALANNGGVVFAHANTFIGSATGGRRYVVQLNGIVNSNSGNPNYFPNDDPGIETSGGQFN